MCVMGVDCWCVCFVCVWSVRFCVYVSVVCVFLVFFGVRVCMCVFVCVCLWCGFVFVLVCVWVCVCE